MQYYSVVDHTPSPAVRNLQRSKDVQSAASTHFLRSPSESEALNRNQAAVGLVTSVVSRCVPLAYPRSTTNWDARFKDPSSGRPISRILVELST